MNTEKGKEISYELYRFSLGESDFIIRNQINLKRMNSPFCNEWYFDHPIISNARFLPNDSLTHFGIFICSEKSE